MKLHKGKKLFAPFLLVGSVVLMFGATFAIYTSTAYSKVKETSTTVSIDESPDAPINLELMTGYDDNLVVPGEKYKLTGWITNDSDCGTWISIDVEDTSPHQGWTITQTGPTDIYQEPGQPLNLEDFGITCVANDNTPSGTDVSVSVTVTARASNSDPNLFNPDTSDRFWSDKLLSIF